MTTTIIAATAAAVSALALVWAYRAVLADIDRPIVLDDDWDMSDISDEDGNDEQDCPHVSLAR